MKSGGALKHFILAFLLAAVCYAVFYHSIEHRRTRKGPWELVFTTGSNGAPTLIINQPKLAITNVQVTFPEQKATGTNFPVTLVLDQPREAPYPVPFGMCVGMNTTFLPGRVKFQLFGHDVELLPRVLLIDHQEHPWLADSTVTLHPPTNTATNQ